MKCGSCGHDNLPEARFCANCGAATSAAPVGPVGTVAAPVALPSVALEYSGFWLRFGAFLVDGIIIVVASSLLSFLGFFAGGTGGLILGFTLPLLFVNPLYWLYCWLFTGLKGQTLGKMLFRIRVVRANGEKVGLGWAALWEIPGRIISYIPLFLGLLWIAWDPKKQGWHDMMAGTIVVHVK